VCLFEYIRTTSNQHARDDADRRGQTHKLTIDKRYMTFGKNITQQNNE